MTENDDLLPDFIAETTDLIEQARRDIVHLNSGEGNRSELLNSIFRAVHTIKGGASIFKYENTKNIAHKLENLLDSWRKNPDIVAGTEIAKMTKIIDYIETLLQSNDKAPSGSTGIANLKLQPESEPSALSKTAPLASTPGSDSYVVNEGNQSNEREEFASLSAELAAVAAEPIISKTDNTKTKNEIYSDQTELSHVRSSKVSQLASKEASSTSKSSSVATEMLRVPVERVQRNLDVISEVFLIRNQMTYLVEKYFIGSPGDHAFVQAWESLDNSLRRSIGELESVAMSMRMMPLNSLFSRMEKTVRAYETESGKHIRVLKNGEDTELDKKVLDALGEPLIHLIRNAMDHGIESIEVRQAAGKAEIGTIKLSAKVAGNEVILTVEDDGNGMAAEKIRQAAANKGIDVSKATDEKSALELIFLPGFSTASKVTETSGRGVGMDVVKSAVERLGGTIGIQTKPGEGTAFVIRLPLSMSVIPAIIVRLNDVLYGVATGDIIETQRVPAKEIKNNAGEFYLKYRGHFIPCHDLEMILQGYDTVERGYQSSVFICIVRHKEGYVALRVGALENNTEIVVKPMPHLSPKIPYVTGISVLPTGQPVFVLSLGRLCREKLISGGVMHEAA